MLKFESIFFEWVSLSRVDAVSHSKPPTRVDNKQSSHTNKAKQGRAVRQRARQHFTHAREEGPYFKIVWYIPPWLPTQFKIEEEFTAAQYIAIALGIVSFFFFFLSMTLMALVLMILSFVTTLTWERLTRPPTNNATRFLTKFRMMSPTRPVLVCLGDSLTHGAMSDSWTARIAPKVAERMKFEKPEPGDFQSPVWVVNAGQNSITSWVILQERLQACMACYPDYIVIMIGTNDVLAVCSPSAANAQIRDFHLPEPPTMENFRRNLSAIMDFLTKASPKTEIGVCTLPPIGEDLSSSTNKLIKEANQIVHSVADAATDKVSVLPVGERIQNEIVSKNLGGKHAMSPAMMTPLAIINAPLHCLLGVTWDALTALSSGSVFHDTLHFNERGGDIIADVVTEWLFTKNIHKAIAVKQF